MARDENQNVIFVSILLVDEDSSVDQTRATSIVFSALFLFCSILLLSSFSNALTYVDSCRTLSVAGETYVMNVSSITSTATCITVTGAGITFNCNGSKIIAANSSAGQGISLSAGSSDSVIKNCNISVLTTGSYGIYGSAAFNNVTIKNCDTRAMLSGAGMFFRFATNSTILDSTASNYGGGSTSSGVHLDGTTSGFNFMNVTAYTAAANIAMRVADSSYNTFTNCSFIVAAGVAGYAIQFSSAFYNNVINSTLSSSSSGFDVYLLDANDSNYFYFNGAPSVRVRFFDTSTWYKVANASNGVVFSSRVGSVATTNFTVKLLTKDLVLVEHNWLASSHYDYYLTNLSSSVLYVVYQNDSLMASNFTNSNGTLYTFLERVAAGNGQLNFSIYGVPTVTPTPAIYAFTRPIPTVQQEDPNPYTGWFVLREFKLTTGSVGIDMYGFMIGCILLFAGFVHVSRN